MIPAAVREAIAAHAREEQPNESCGLVSLRGSVAERYVPGTNRAQSPYRFELEVDPYLWVELEDEGFELVAGERVDHVTRNVNLIGITCGSHTTV